MQKNVITINNTPQVLIGTAGWSYKDWVGSFYPPGIKQNDMLSYYARFFNIIEVNATFYRELPHSFIEGWIEKTQFRDDFQFILKINGAFTHQRDYTRNQAEHFCKNLELLAEAGKLKGILMQFPYSFNADNAAYAYVTKLINQFSLFPRFLEFRHASWMKHEIIESLRNLDNTVCVIDQPSIGKATAFQLTDPGKILYLRLHGRNEAAWAESIEHFKENSTYAEQSERYNYLYNRGELLEIVIRIKQVIKQLQEVVIITNNHPHGNAVINAFEFTEFLKVKTGEQPPMVTQSVMKKLGRIV